MSGGHDAENKLLKNLSSSNFQSSGDLLGLILAWFSLLPSFTVISFVPIIVLRRDLTTVS